jgi:uncharacterized iron-regulated membrane protein
MKTFRTVLFWLHLVAGTVAGVVVLIMSVTGVLLMYEKQIIAWADTRSYQAGPSSPGASPLPIETLLTRVREQRPNVTPATVVRKADPNAPVALGLGREGNIYVNAYTGAILGAGSQGTRDFFRSMTDWHRWLAMSGENRATGRAITGASNALFLFIVISGFYLWFPRKWNWAQFRNVLWFRRRLPSKARDFNWHNVIGFWSVVPLFVIVLSGVVISYPFAGNMVYRIVGEQPPAPQRPGGGGPGGPGPGGAGPGGAARAEGPRGEGRDEGARAEGGRGEGPRAEGQRAEGPRAEGGRDGAPRGEGGRGDGGRAEGGRGESARGEGQRAEGPRGEGERAEGPRGEGRRGGEGQRERGGPAVVSLDGLNAAWTRAENQVSDWKTISLRVPTSPAMPAVFTIDQGYAGQPQKRGTLTLNRATGEVVRWETFDSLSRGRQLRSWLRFSHTGEYYGLIGQTIAGLVSAGGAVLVYTGLALALRRFLAWRKRKSAATATEAVADERQSTAA